MTQTILSTSAISARGLGHDTVILKMKIGQYVPDLTDPSRSDLQVSGRGRISIVAGGEETIIGMDGAVITARDIEIPQAGNARPTSAQVVLEPGTKDQPRHLTATELLAGPRSSVRARWWRSFRQCGPVDRQWRWHLDLPARGGRR